MSNSGSAIAATNAVNTVEYVAIIKEGQVRNYIWDVANSTWVKDPGTIVNISGLQITVDVSGDPVNVSGNAVFVYISGGSTSVSGNAVTVSGNHVDTSGNYFASGQWVEASVSGNHVDTSGNYFASGQTVDIDGQTVDIDGQAIYAYVSNDIYAYISNDLVATVSGNWVDVSGATVNIYTDVSGAYLASGQSVLTSVSGNVLTIASGQIVALVSGQSMTITSGTVVALISGQSMTITSGTVISFISGQAVVTIDQITFKTWQGECFRCSELISGMSANVAMDYLILTSSHNTHLKYTCANLLDCIMDLYETPIVTSNGVQLVVTNTNRISNNVNITTVYTSSNISATGTHLSKRYIPQYIGWDPIGSEFILKQNNAYLLRVESLASANILHTVIRFYEGET